MMVIFDAKSDDINRYNWKGDLKDLTGEDITKFIGEWKAGNIYKHLISTERPDVDTIDGLTSIVGSSWHEIILDPSKDKIVLYYGEWCPHCKSLMPVWEELAKYYEGSDSLVVGRLEAETNEIDGAVILKYPTIRFYDKDYNIVNKKVHEYAGHKTLEDFKKYIIERSSAIQET